MKLGFNAPWEVGFAIVGQNNVIAFRVDVFCVDEEAIHVEQTGAHGWEAGIQSAYCAIMTIA